MSKAVVHPISTSQEQWVALRPPPPTKGGQVIAVRQHGKSADPGGVPGSAVVPATVPDLPDCYQPRDADLGKLKSVLLSKSNEGPGGGGANIKIVAAGTGRDHGFHGKVPTLQFQVRENRGKQVKSS